MHSCPSMLFRHSLSNPTFTERIVCHSTSFYGTLPRFARQFRRTERHDAPSRALGGTSPRSVIFGLRQVPETSRSRRTHLRPISHTGHSDCRRGKHFAQIDTFFTDASESESISKALLQMRPETMGPATQPPEYSIYANWSLFHLGHRLEANALIINQLMKDWCTRRCTSGQVLA